MFHRESTLTAICLHDLKIKKSVLQMEPFIVLNTTRPNTEGQKQTDRSYLLKQTTEIKYLIPRLIFAVLDVN